MRVLASTAQLKTAKRGIMIYDYTDNGIPDDALVDTESPGFLERVAWLQRNSPARSWEIGEYVGVGIDGKGHARGSVTYHGDEGRFVMLDAYLLDRSPNVALPEIYSALGVALLSPVPQYDPAPPISVDPVGDPWPQRGPNIWHVSAAFDPKTWPHGGTPFSKRVDGRDVTFYRTTVRGGTSTGQGFGGGAQWVPAWTDKPTP